MDKNDFPYPLQEILETWTLQMGYPLITVSRDSSTNKIIVSQETFLMDPEDTPADPQPGVTYKYRAFYNKSTNNLFSTIIFFS